MDPAIARILDANANRAREALRVLEEFARLGLDDPSLSTQIKSLRHELARTVGDDLGGLLVRARDIVSDVGRGLATDTEYSRGHIHDVAVAAGKRAAEALRVMEEYTKTFDADRSRRLEQLRYSLYEIERATAVRIGARERFGGVRLYVLITESLCSGPWLDTASRAIEGGADCIQLREKSLPDDELLRRTRALAKQCRDAGVLLIVNDRPDIARLGGADGVHVGQDDLPVSDARRIAGPSLLVGVSTHTIEQARAAMDASPDYIAVGPMFTTQTKPQERIPGPPLLAAIRSQTSLPVVPIGGVDEENISSLLEAGAVCACVCRVVIAERDVSAAARRLKERIRPSVKKRTPAPEAPHGVR